MREVALAGSRRADEDHVLALVEEGAGGKVDDACPGKVGVEPKIEALYCSVVLKIGSSKPGIELLPVPPLHLVAQKAREELGVGEVVGDRLVDP